MGFADISFTHLRTLKIISGRIEFVTFPQLDFHHQFWYNIASLDKGLNLAHFERRFAQMKTLKC